MKKILSVCFVISFFILCPLSVCCAESKTDFSQVIDEINHELENSLDSNVCDLLDEEKISIKEPESISKINIKNVITYIWNSFTKSLKQPLKMLGKILAVSIICIFIKNISPNENSCSDVFSTLCILTVILIISDTISESFESLKNSIDQINNFLTAYIPIYASVAGASGCVLSSGSYSTIMMFICEVMALISSNILIPFLSAVLAFTLVAAINPSLKYGEIAETLKKSIIWLLSISMLLFVGLMTIQGLTGSAADGLAVKAVKFAASSFIPVVGSSVSEAYSTVKGSLGVIRTSVGSIGVIIVFLIVIKPIISIISIKFIIWISKIVNDLFGQKEISDFLKSTNSIISIGLSVIVVYAIVFIIETSVLMITALNSGG